MAAVTEGRRRTGGCSPAAGEVGSHIGPVMVGRGVVGGRKSFVVAAAPGRAVVASRMLGQDTAAEEGMRIGVVAVAVAGWG